MLLFSLNTVIVLLIWQAPLLQLVSAQVFCKYDSICCSYSHLAVSLPDVRVLHASDQLLLTAHMRHQSG